MEKAKLDKLYLKIIITYDDYVYFKFRDKNIHEALNILYFFFFYKLS